MDNGTNKEILPIYIHTKDIVPSSRKPSISMGSFCPELLKRDQKVTLLQNEIYKHGFLEFE